MKQSSYKLPSTPPPPLFMRSAGSIDVAVAGESPKFIHINDFKEQSSAIENDSRHYHHDRKDNTSDEEEDFFIATTATNPITIGVASANIAASSLISYPSVLNAVITKNQTTSNNNNSKTVDDLIQKISNASTSYKPKVVNVVEIDESNQFKMTNKLSNQKEQQQSQRNSNINIIQHASKVYICKDGIYVHEKCPKTNITNTASSGDKSGCYYDEVTNTRITFVPVVRDDETNSSPHTPATSSVAIGQSSAMAAHSSYHNGDAEDEEDEEESVIRPVNYANVYEQHYFPQEINLKNNSKPISDNRETDEEGTIINRLNKRGVYSMIDYFTPVKSRTLAPPSLILPPPSLPILSPYQDLDVPFSLSRLEHDEDGDDFRRRSSKTNTTTNTTRATTTTTNTHSDISQSQSQSTSDHPSQKVANIIRDLIDMAQKKKSQTSNGRVEIRRDSAATDDDEEEEDESLFDTGKLRSSTFVENDLTSARPYRDVVMKQQQQHRQENRDFRSYVPKILLNNNHAVTPLGGERLSNSNSNTSINLENLARHYAAMEAAKNVAKQQQSPPPQHTLQNQPQRRPSILKNATNQQTSNKQTISSFQSGVGFKTSPIKLESERQQQHQQASEQKNRILEDLLLLNKRKSSPSTIPTLPQQKSMLPNTSIEKPKYVLTKVSRHIEKTIIREKIGEWVPVKNRY